MIPASREAVAEKTSRRGRCRPFRELNGTCRVVSSVRTPCTRLVGFWSGILA